MGKFKRVFDPLDLEIINQVYEATWAYVEARQPHRDIATDAERQEALRKRIFILARFSGRGKVDFDNLTDAVLTTMPEQWIPAGRRVSPEADCDKRAAVY